MKKLLIFTTCLLLISTIKQPIMSKNLFSDIGINLGFNNFRLIGGTTAIQPMFVSPYDKSVYSVGGLNYIEPGVDLSTTLFLDDKNIHRIIAGTEYTYMYPKEIATTRTNYSYYYCYHKVCFFDAYLGYHFSFYKAPFQNVRMFSGLEIMFNNIILNEFEFGTKAIKGVKPPEGWSGEERSNYEKKDPDFRVGSRIRAGFEGRIKPNVYIVASGTLGIYNLLNRNDATGELFSIQNKFDKKESYQPFFNFLISFQYRFNDVE